MSARRLKFETPSTLQQLNFLRNLYYERTDRSKELKKQKPEQQQDRGISL